MNFQGIILNSRMKFFAFVLLNIVLIFFIHGYLESYEGLYSVIVHGTYTDPAISDGLQDFHTLLFSLYARINQFFLNYNIYGIILYLLNLFSLTFFAYVLNSYFKKYVILFFLCYTFFAIDSILNISSNRIIITLVLTVYFYIIQKGLNKSNLLSLLGILFFCLLVKAEIVLLLSVIFTLGLLISKQLDKKYVFLFLFILMYFIVIQTVFAKCFTEARQTFLYHEFDFIDKSNIDYKKLNASQLLNVNAFKNNNLVDSIHFTNSFYEQIKFDNFFFSKMNFKQSFINTYKTLNITFSFFFLNLFLLSLVFFLKTKYRLLAIYFFLFPLFTSLIINIPERFIITYFSFLTLFLIKLIIENEEHTNQYKVICSVVLVLAIINLLIKVPSEKNNYKQTQFKVEHFFNTIDKLKLGEDFLVIHNVEYLGRYFPTDPFYKIPNKNVAFLNFWFFNSYNSYINYWKNKCKCNPLSIIAKIDFMVENNIKFVISDDDFKILQEYIYAKYGKMLKANRICIFDKELYVIKLSY